MFNNFELIGFFIKELAKYVRCKELMPHLNHSGGSRFTLLALELTSA